jgi:hypothetical protein
MRRSLRFFSSCSSPSVIFLWPPVEQKIFAGYAPEDHALQPIQVIETITGGLSHCSQQRFPRILAHEPQQLPQGKRDHLAAPLLQARHIFSQLGRSSENGALFRMRVGPRLPLAPRRPVLGQRDSLVLRFGDAPVRD